MTAEEKDADRQVEQQEPDLEVSDDAAENVKGGDASLVSNIMKTKHDTAKNSINNVR
jgi:hypothetical protein